MKKNYFVFACAFFFSLGGNILNFLLVYRLTDWLSFSPGQVGVYLATGQFFYFFGCNLYHRFGSAFNPVKVFTFASILVFFVSIPLAHTRVTALVYASYWILQIGHGSFWPPVMAWLSAGLSEKDINREFGVFNQCWMGASIAGPLVAGSLYRWNSTAAFFVLNISYFLVLLNLFLLYRFSRRSFRQKDAGLSAAVSDGPGGTAPSAVTEKAAVIRKLDKKMDMYRYKGWLSGFCSSLFVGILVNIVPLYVRDGLGFTEQSAGLILFMRSAAGFTGFIVLARFTRWHFNKRWFIALQSALIFCGALYLFAGNKLAVFFTIAGFYGFLNAGCYNNSIFYSGATGANPKKNLALHEIFLCAGNAAGTAGGGFMYQHFRFTGMCLALIAALGLGLAAFVLLDKRAARSGT